MPTQFLTSVGRIVWGHPMKLTAKTDQRTKQKVLKDGKEIMVSAFGVAFPKAEFLQNIWPHMGKEIATGYPAGAPQGFSYKYKDGDGVSREGKPYNLREGWAGCYILTVSTEAFTPAVYKSENGVFRQLAEHEIKTGDFVRVSISCVLNVPKVVTQTPSLYINPQGIELVGYGHEIFNGPDAATMFGAAAPAVLPPGASATPIANPNAPMMPGMQQPPGAVPPGTMGYPSPGYPQGAPGMSAQHPGMQPGGMQPGYPGGMPPGQAPQMPGGYPQPTVNGVPTGYPQQQPMPGGYPPAHDFVGNATGGFVPGQQPMPGYPQQQPQMPPQAAPGAFPPGYPQPPALQYQPNMTGQPMPGQAPAPGYPQPGGYPPGNR